MNFSQLTRNKKISMQESVPSGDCRTCNVISWLRWGMLSRNVCGARSTSKTLSFVALVCISHGCIWVYAFSFLPRVWQYIFPLVNFGFISCSFQGYSTFPICHSLSGQGGSELIWPWPLLIRAAFTMWLKRISARHAYLSSVSGKETKARATLGDFWLTALSNTALQFY